MAVVINSASQITLTGGTSGAPLLMTHLVTLSNWPAGTTQATVDSYITRTSDSYTFNINSGKLIMCQGYLDMSDATIKHEGQNSYIVADNGGVIAGGKYVGGKVFGRTTWLFDSGAQSNPHPSSVNEGFLRGSGQINMIGLRILSNRLTSSVHTGIVFWAGSTGSYNLQDLEILSEANAPVYATFNTNNTAVGASSVSIREARVGTIRHSNEKINLSFVDGGGGWIGGDNNSQENKFLIPPVKTTYVGLEPVFQNSGNFINITTFAFKSPSIVLKNAGLDVGRITMYPNTTTNRAEILRTFFFKIQNLSGDQVNNVKARVTSQRVITTGGVPASAVTTELFNNEVNYNANQDITVWLGTGARAGTGNGTYIFPDIITDDRNISILFRHLSYFEQNATTNSEIGSVSFTNALVPDSYYTSQTSLHSGLVFTKATSAIDLSGLASSITVDDLYDFCKVYLKNNMDVVNFLSPSGTTLNFGTWNVVGIEKLTAGTKLKTIQSSGTVSAASQIQNLAIVGNVTQATPTNLSNVQISGTLTYNTNTATSVSISNGTEIGTVQNSGTGIVTISRDSTSTITTYTDAEINFLDSNITFAGVTAIKLFASEEDANQGVPGGVLITSSPFNFKYGSTQSGVLLSGLVHIRYELGGAISIGSITLNQGDNMFSLTDNQLLQSLNSSLRTVNRNVIKASKLIPANEQV